MSNDLSCALSGYSLHKKSLLTHLGESISPPRLMRARAQPIWEMQGATTSEDEPQPQLVLENQLNQRIAG